MGQGEGIRADPWHDATSYHLLLPQKAVRLSSYDLMGEETKAQTGAVSARVGSRDEPCARLSDSLEPSSTVGPLWTGAHFDGTVPILQMKTRLCH